MRESYYLKRTTTNYPEKEEIKKIRFAKLVSGDISADNFDITFGNNFDDKSNVFSDETFNVFSSENSDVFFGKTLSIFSGGTFGVSSLSGDNSDIFFYNADDNIGVTSSVISFRKTTRSKTTIPISIFISDSIIIF